VKLQIEEGLPVSWLSKEVGTSKDVIRRWVKLFFDIKLISHLLKREFFLNANFRQLINGLKTGIEDIDIWLKSVLEADREVRLAKMANLLIFLAGATGLEPNLPELHSGRSNQLLNVTMALLAF
jgi:hypothetical protein